MIPMQISAVFLRSFLYKYQPAQPPSTPQSFPHPPSEITGFWLGPLPLLWSRNASRQKATENGRFTSFVSLLSGITVPHCLVPDVYKQFFYVFLLVLLFCFCEAWHQLLSHERK